MTPNIRLLHRHSCACHILSLLLMWSLATVHAAAQKKQTLYNDMHKKVLEGSWTFSSAAGNERLQQIAALLTEVDRDIYAQPADYFLTAASTGITFRDTVRGWYKNGRPAFMIRYNQGVLNGIYRRWYFYGNKEVDGAFREGRPVGDWVWYYPNGARLMTATYPLRPQQKRSGVIPDGCHTQTRQEKLNSHAIRGFSNPVRWLGPYLPEGRVQVFGEDGTMVMQLNFRNGSKDGHWILRDRKGKKAEVVYRDDMVVALYNRYGHNVAKDSALNENLTQIYYAYQHIPPKNLKPPLPEGTEPFTNVESWPKFPGGDSALKAYINMHLRFPQENLRVRKEANVGIACIIDAKGKISDVHVFNGVGYGCDEEAIRLVKGMPDWIPARHKDIPVPVYFRMSVPFVLPKGL